MHGSQLRQDIVDELEFDPRFSAEHIGVAVDNDVVTLTGHIGSYAEKIAVIDATRRVKGVRAIADELEVRYPSSLANTDDQIAQRALDILSWSVLVPKNAVQLLVKDGWVVLDGKVSWFYQKRAAEDDVRKLAGVRGVTNNIEIVPAVSIANVQEKITAALKRHAELEAKDIRVSIKNGSTVVLEGNVDNWDERFAVENAAWSAPGVTSVDDRLKIA